MQKCQNRLFVAFKPSFISSNAFLSGIKRKYKIKKAGFSGTLDPFARGVLIIAFGQYTKLFKYLKKAPKKYKATLWLGAKSETLDIEKIKKIENIKPFKIEDIKKAAKSLIGEVEYLPPKYSAKKIEGKRAYELARENKDFETKSVKSTIYDIKILHYIHPFVTFEITVSEGGYVRSIAHMLAKKLKTEGSLSYLERIYEGEFFYEKERALDPIKYLNLKENFYKGDIEDIIKGKRLYYKNFEIQEEGDYFLKIKDLLSLIRIKNKKVSYLLNGIKLC